MVLWLSRGRQGCQSAAVKGLFRRDNDWFGNAAVGSVTPRALDGGLVGFGTGIAKKDLVGDRVFAQPVGKSRLRWNQVEVGAVVDLVHLRGNSGREFSVGVSQDASGNTRDKV